MKDKLWFNEDISEIANRLGTDIVNGLTDEQYKNKLAEFGYNELKEKDKSTILEKFLNQFKDFMIIILIIAAVVSGIVSMSEGEGLTDSIIILCIVIVNAVIGVVQEVKAENSLEALKKMSGYSATVIRDGKTEIVATKELVPGDIVILETGEIVPADIRIIESINLKSQEASLTGESVPVDKSINVIDDTEIAIGDRINMLFSSSTISYGRGKGIVVETGMNTQVGKIADMLDNADSGDTPLQKKLDALGKILGIGALTICAIIFVVGLIYGKEIIHMFMSAVSLAVAAIPEGLPAIATIALAIGVQRMVKRNAIVRKLPSVETLGCATVICSDKTGTLTQNKMSVVRMFYNNHMYRLTEVEKNEGFNKILKTGILCNESKIILENDIRNIVGDPTETILVELGFDYGMSKIEYNTKHERIGEVPFESERKLMSTINVDVFSNFVHTKGAVDELLKICKYIEIDGDIKEITQEDKDKILNCNESMAVNALRVLGFAYKPINELPEKVESSTIEKDLIFIGMVGMIDPPRPEVKAAVAKCKEAGIKTVMITGDHLTTAVAIAKRLGILEEGGRAILGNELEKMSDEELKNCVKEISVYARVSPEHKVRIVKAWQANGDIVAMTGDGVNDAPSLKTSNIGCAMGITGTDVSKEAADVVLTDDNFSTIVSAVEEGRRIYDNILKAIQFLISSNIGEIISLFTVIMATPLIAKAFGIENLGLIEALLPIHILWVNLVTDSLPALALSVEPAEANIMQRKPNTDTKHVFTKGMIWRIIYQGIMIATLTLIAFTIGLNITTGTDEERMMVAQTMAFGVLAISQITHSFNLKSNVYSIFKTGILNNKALILAAFVSLGLMLIVLQIPALEEIFSVSALSIQEILIVAGLSLMPLVIVEIFKKLKINTLGEKNIYTNVNKKY
ncbi:MAG: calcium-translocating P-type ATPase, PMCA-type [Clostridia bacterium]|nr:calcium-translocating P-type ATPase, PMCA-type [Clostridia bacterium]